MGTLTSIADLIQGTFPGTDEHQMGAITAPIDTHVLVTAPPGSGKTRVLAGRYMYLAASGIDPERIAAVTFTNKAANEMKTRIGRAFGWDAKRIKGLPVATFHSLSARWLRKYAALAGVKSNFTIYDEDQSRVLMKRVVSDNGLPLNPDHALSLISLLKSLCVDVDELYQAAWSYNSGLGRFLSQIEKTIDGTVYDLQQTYRLYQEALRAANALDFDDLLMYAIRFIEERGGLEVIGVDYLLVDECQDINTAQYYLIAAMASRGVMTYLVGDIDQSIYMFRGARPDLIEDYVAQFEPLQKRLVYNYRSREAIVSLSSDIIKPNYAGSNILFEPMQTNRPGGSVDWVNVSPFLSTDAADKVDTIPFEARLVKALVDTGCRPGDIAVLSRYNSTLAAVWNALLSMGIPAYLPASKGGARMDNPLRWALSLLSNSQDTVSLFKLLESIKGVGKVTASKVLAACAGCETPQALSAALASAAGDLNNGVRPRLEMLAGLFAELSSYLDNLLEPRPLVDVIDRAAAVLYQLVKREEELFESRHPFIFAAEDMTASSADLAEYLSFISLVASEPPPGDDSVVKLSTVHAAKGLEYRVVIIPDYEMRFPVRDYSTAEERRVFYVALTRAIDAAFIVTHYDSGIYDSTCRTAFAISALRGLPVEPFEVKQPFIADLYLAKACDLVPPAID